VVENSLGFLFTCSLEGRLTSLNAFTAETLGYRAEALTGRSVADFWMSRGGHFQECLKTLETKEEWQGALRCAAATASTAASPSAAAAWSCPANGPSCSTTAST
jgi:PAS domain-containing protein